ncbi:MAG: hypothetical protein GY799_16975 [Desulfobulbaceae bacterium]|nr:hypothetical protein [Desulfobulbaceae bacterium]
MEIVVDWNQVQSEEKFYDNFLHQIEAPEWHGRNLNALRDSIVTGDINRIEPPYTIQSNNESSTPENLKIFQTKVLGIFQDAIKEGREIRVIST